MFTSQLPRLNTQPEASTSSCYGEEDKPLGDSAFADGQYEPDVIADEDEEVAAFEEEVDADEARAEADSRRRATMTSEDHHAPDEGGDSQHEEEKEEEEEEEEKEGADDDDDEPSPDAIRVSGFQPIILHKPSSLTSRTMSGLLGRCSQQPTLFQRLLLFCQEVPRCTKPSASYNRAG